MNLFNIFENDDNKPQDTRDSLTKTIDKLAARYPTTPVDKLAARYPDKEVKEWEDTAPGHDCEQTELTPVEEDFTGDTNYTYTVFIDGTKEGTYGSKEEAKAVVRRKKEQAPGRDYRIAPKPRTSAASIRRFQKNRDRNIDEAEERLRVSPHDAGMHAAVKGKPYDSNPHPAGSKEHLEWSKGHNAMRARKADLDEVKADPTGSWVVHNGSKVVKFKTHNGATAYAEKNGGKVASSEFYADKVQNKVSEHGGGGDTPRQWHAYVRAHRTDEGWQDFDKKEPWEVCLAGKPVKSFDYYQDARRFHDNWKKKLYNQGEQEKADKITLNPIMKEAYSKTPPILELLKDLATQWQDGSDTAYDAISQLGWNIADDRKGVYIIKQSDMSGRSKIYFPELTAEGSMADAEHHDTGPEFTGYWKGTDSATPGDKMVGAAESKEMKVPAARNFVAKNMKSAGAGQHKDAKRAMKQGDVKHKARAIPMDEFAMLPMAVTNLIQKAVVPKPSEELQSISAMRESVNFMEWAVAQGSRFPNFAGNPAVYAAAKAAYIAEGFGTALANVSSKISGHPRKMKSAQQIRNKAMKFAPQPIAETDVEEDYVSEIKKGQKDSNGNSTCWDGYHADGTKPGKNGPVRNCVKNENVEEDWQKANKKDKTDGMSQKAVNAYKREHPGSKLKTAVTTKPSKLKKGSKASKRRKSYCSRSKGQMKMHSISCAKTPDKAICKARRRWNCEGVEHLDAMLAEAIEKGRDLQPGQYYIWTVFFDDGSKKRIKVTKENFDPKAYYAKKNQVVINTEYDWEVHNG